MTNLESESFDPTEAPDDLGPTEEIAQEAPQEEAQPAEYDLLDTTEIADKYVPIKVNGEEQYVPLGEALQGYQRESAWTQNQQRLAERERELESQAQIGAALQTDPQLAVQVLARQAGVSVEEYLGLPSPSAQQSQTGYDPYEEDDFTFSDPSEAKLAKELEQERQARLSLEERLDMREANEILQGAFSDLQRKYGATEEAQQAVLKQALDMGVGPEMFSMIYESQQYSQARQKWEATRQAQAQKQAKQTQRQQSAAAATQIVGQGGGAPAPQAAQPPQEFKSTREAIEAAFRQHDLI